MSKTLLKIGRFGLLAALFVLLPPARAVAASGMILVEHIDGGARQSGEMIVKTLGNKIRADISPVVSMIIDSETGEVTTLMHPSKMILRMSTEAAGRLLERVRKEGQAVTGATDGGFITTGKLQPTGKHQTVNGAETEVFTSQLGSVQATYWIAKDYPNGQRVLGILKQIQSSAMGVLARGMTGQSSDLPGVPVKTEMRTSPKAKLTVTLTSVTEGPVDEADFSPPSDYRELPAPMFVPDGER